MISVLPKEKFYQGIRTVGYPLPHATVMLGEDQLSLETTSLALRYIGKDATIEIPFQTNDLCLYTESDGLFILGRKTNFIQE